MHPHLVLPDLVHPVLILPDLVHPELVRPDLVQYHGLSSAHECADEFRDLLHNVRRIDSQSIAPDRYPDLVRIDLVHPGIVHPGIVHPS